MAANSLQEVIFDISDYNISAIAQGESTYKIAKKGKDRIIKIRCGKITINEDRKNSGYLYLGSKRGLSDILEIRTAPHMYENEDLGTEYVSIYIRMCDQSITSYYKYQEGSYTLQPFSLFFHIKQNATIDIYRKFESEDKAQIINSGMQLSNASLSNYALLDIVNNYVYINKSNIDVVVPEITSMMVDSVE